MSFHSEKEATLDVLGHYKKGYQSLFQSNGESKVKNLNNFFLSTWQKTSPLSQED